MGRKCTICSNKERAQIEASLAENVTYRQVGAACGVTIDAIKRHRKNCIPAQLQEARELGLLEPIISKVRRLKPVMGRLERIEFAFGLLEKAIQEKTTEDGQSLLSIEELTAILREMRGWNDQAARLSGEYLRGKDNPGNVARAQALDWAAQQLVSASGGQLTLADARARLEDKLALMQGQRG